MIPKKKFNKNKYLATEESPEYPVITFKVIDDEHVFTKVEWPENASLQMFGNLIVAIANGDMYEDIKTAIRIHGVAINQLDRANLFNNEIDRLCQHEHEHEHIHLKKPLVPPSQFMKYTSKRNFL